MAIRVYRVAVVGCPRAVIDPNGVYDGVGKSCLCSSFIRPGSFSETHASLMSEEEWREGPVTNGDHFIYWGAATRHLPDGSKARFQIVEQTEFYRDEGPELVAHSCKEDYLTRASAVHFRSTSAGKTAHTYKPAEGASRRIRGPVRNTQLFPNEDFGGKKGVGIFGYICVFDPTVEGEQMTNQLRYLSHLLPLLAKRKRKIVVACVKCDAVDEIKIQFGSSVANHALKKAIPFLEVSAHDAVNVEEAFFALVSPPKKHKLSKNGKRSLSGYFTYKGVLESRKGDLNRAKDVFRKLLQKQLINFSTYWNEFLPTIENQPAYRAVLELAGNEGEEVVKKMFQLRLIEIKLMEASKLHGFYSKKLNKDQSQSYQDYLSEAFKGHPDLGNESLYDYVYSPRSSLVSDASPTDEATEILTEPSLPSSYRNTPDIQSSHHNIHLTEAVSAALADISRPRSSTLPDNLTSPLPEHFSSFTLPRTPSQRKSSKTNPSNMPPPLPSRDIIVSKTKGTITHSQSYLEGISEKVSPARQDSETKRLSSSMDCLLAPDGPGDDDDSAMERYKELIAEPYLQPMEVKEMMAQTLPPLPSPKADQRNSSVFMSMRVRAKSRPALPLQAASDKASISPYLPRSVSFERKGHKRSISNPWVLESLAGDNPPKLPPRNTEIPPPVPPRPSESHPSTSSGGNSFGDVESSLEFTNRPPLPPTPRHGNTERSPVMVVRKIKDLTANDSRNSRTFQQIDQSSQNGSTDNMFAGYTDPPDSPSSRDIYDEDEDDDDPSNHYARIEDMQKYVQMSSAPVNITPQDKARTIQNNILTVSELNAVDYGRKTQSMGKAHVDTPTKKELPPSTSATLLTLKRKWKKQRNGPVIHDPVTASSDSHNRLSQPISSLPKQSPSHERMIRPLPPSPKKAVRHQFSTNNNIYERIDDVMRWSRRSSRQDSTEQTWTPPVDVELWPKYVEAVVKFFDNPDIRQQWIETLKSVMPDEEDVDEILPPYCKQTLPARITPTEQQEEDIMEEYEKIEANEDSDSSPPPTRAKVRPTPSAQGVDDQIVIDQPNPISPTIPQSPFVKTFSSSVPASPFRIHQVKLNNNSNQNTPFQSPNFRPRHISTSAIASSRDDLIQIMNQQLNNQDSLSDSDSDDDNEQVPNSSDSEPDSDIEETPNSVHNTKLHNTPVHLSGTVKQKVAAFLQTDLDEAIGLRASVSTDSDLVGDLGSDLATIPDDSELVNSPTSNGVHGGVEVIHNIKPSQFIKKRVTPKRRNQNLRQDVNEATRNLSDSGISNCHSQTFEDGFSVSSSHPNTNNSESEC